MKLSAFQREVLRLLQDLADAEDKSAFQRRLIALQGFVTLQPPDFEPDGASPLSAQLLALLAEHADAGMSSLDAAAEIAAASDEVISEIAAQSGDAGDALVTFIVTVTQGSIDRDQASIAVYTPTGLPFKDLVPAVNILVAALKGNRPIQNPKVPSGDATTND
jgi:hypothetical protein